MEQEVSVYNVFSSGFHELPTLEDAFLKGYRIDDKFNKIDKFNVRCMPVMIPHALKIIKYENKFASISHVERIAIIYGISHLQVNPDITKILEYNSKVSLYCEDEETLNSFNAVTKMNFLTASCTSETSISCLAWCKDWLSSNSRDFGLTIYQLGIYCLIYGLSAYNLRNQTVREKLNKEKEYFMKYIRTKCENITKSGVL